MYKDYLSKLSTIKNFAQIITLLSDMVPERSAFRFRAGKEIISKTYGDFTGDVKSAVSMFLSAGYDGNFHIALIGENSYDWIVAYFAIILSGNIAVPLDKDLSDNEIADGLLQGNAKAVVYMESYADSFTEIHEKLSDLRFYRIGGKVRDWEISWRRSLEESVPALDLSKSCRDSEKMSVLIFTSGTTAKRKGVMLSQTSILSNLHELVDNFDMFFDRVLISLPLHHSYGMIFMIWQIFSANETFISDSIRKLGEDLAVYKPQLIPLVPLYVESFYKQVCSIAEEGSDAFRETLRNLYGGSAELLVCGGAYINPFYITEYRKSGLNLINVYGISECSPGVSLGLGNDVPLESVGKSFKCSKVLIDNPDSDGIGEICVKGPQIMLGYYEMPEETAEVIKNGTFHTGDMGRLDDNGYLYLTGRKKFLIIASNGKNISPEELEIPFNRLPYILEGIVRQEANEIIAEIVFNPEHLNSKGKEELCLLFEKDLHNINKQTVSYKRISRFIVRDTEFPKTAAKKIIRH